MYKIKEQEINMRVKIMQVNAIKPLQFGISLARFNLHITFIAAGLLKN